MSVLQEVDHINNTVVLILQYFQCLRLMYFEVVCEQVSLGTKVQPQIILKPDYLPDYLSVSYDYGLIKGSTYRVSTVASLLTYRRRHET